MLNYLAMLIVIGVAFYTTLFGIENLKNKNTLGFWGIMVLALVIVVLPFYMLFFLN